MKISGLSLFLERFKQITHRRFYSGALNAQKLAKQIFETKVPFILDTKEELLVTSLTVSLSIKWAEYYWQEDAEKIYCKKISAFCRKHYVDFDSMVYYCLCHETGHAKDQRLFEEIGFFPNTVLPTAIRSESTNLVLTRPQLVYFMHYICDFIINKELAKHDLKNPFGRKAAAFLYEESGRMSKTTTRAGWDYLSDYFVLNSFLNLPLNLDTYEHGGLDEKEKQALKVAQEKVVGDKWEKTLSKLKRIEFFNAKSKRDMMLELFENTLGIQHAYLECNVNPRSLKGCSRLPMFWTKDSYCVINLE